VSLDARRLELSRVRERVNRMEQVWLSGWGLGAHWGEQFFWIFK